MSGLGLTKLLSIKDDESLIGGAIVEDMGNHISEIDIFFLTVEYQSKGVTQIGKEKNKRK